MMTALGVGRSQFPSFPTDPRARHQRQVLDDADDRRDPAAPRAAHRRVHLAAPDRLPRTRADRRARAGADGVRVLRSPARTMRGRAGQPHARRGRPRDPVRTADGRRAVGDGASRRSRWRSSRPGSAGATTPRAWSTRGVDGAHERRARAHALARSDARATSPRRSSRSSSPGATLVLGEDLAPAGARGGRAGGGASAARRSSCPRAAAGPLELRARGAFQRRNFALARGRRGGATSRARGIATLRATQALREAAAADEVPGRLQVARRRPADGARRRAQPRRGRGAGRVAAGSRWRGAAGARARRARGQGRRGHARGAAAAVRARMVHRSAERPRALPPAALQSLARQLGFDAAACEPRRARALAQAQRWARRARRRRCSPPARSTSSASCSRLEAGAAQWSGVLAARARRDERATGPRCSR